MKLTAKEFIWCLAAGVVQWRNPLTASKHLGHALLAVMLATALSTSASAQTNDSEQLVLNAIESAAEHICSAKSEPGGEGSKQKDAVEAEWGKLAKQLASLGINIEGRKSAEALTKFIQGENEPDCKAQTSNKIVERLLDEAPQAETLLVLQCDRLASHPTDNTRPSGIRGVYINLVDSAKAVPACRNALRVRPNDLRIEFQLGRSLQKNGNPSAMEEAAHLYKLAADQGNGAAQSNLGVFYENGLGGLKKNVEEATRLYREAADKGFGAAQDRLGLFYEQGRGGLAKSDEEAARLYKLAADRGYSVAQHNLGRFYEQGRGGLAKSDEEAAGLYKLAADKGMPTAQYDLGRFYEMGRGGLKKSDEEAARLYKLAADQGNRAAQYTLARFYETGRGGLVQDNKEAERLYVLAARQGYASGDEPMRIEVVRSSQPGCEPICAEWVSAEGRIDWGAAERLRKVLNSLGGRKLPILIHSGGGSLYPAELMGYLIRSRKLDVAIGRTSFDSCAHTPAGCKKESRSGPVGEPSLERALCTSACSLVLAGGVRRFVGPEARLGVHNFDWNTPTVEKWRQTYRGKVPIDSVLEKSFAPPAAANARTYFRKMGISEELEDLAFATPTYDMRFLTETELLRARIATDIKSGHDVVYP